MTTDLIQHLIDMPTDELQPILHQVLDTEASPAGPWSATEIGRSVGMATAGIYRIAGSASTSAGVQPWSVVVKVLGPPRIPNREFDAAAAHRELAVYRSGVFASQQSRVRSPRCFAIEAWNDLHFIWLEDLSAAPQPPWSPEYFIQTAHHIGQFNGNWSEATLPDWTWLSPDDLRTKYQSPKHAKLFARLSALQKDPVVGRALPPDVAQNLLQLWQDSDELLRKVEETSKSLCHRDYHSKNLFPIPDTGAGSFTIALDWANVGVEYLGADIGLLLASAIKWLELSLDEAEALVEPIFDAYLVGLAEAGWSGNEEQVRLTYLTCLGMGEAIRTIGIAAIAVDHPDSHASFEQLMLRPVEQIFERWEETLRFFLTYKDRALQLARGL